MNYSELMDEIDTMPGEKRKVMRRLAQTIGAGGSINGRYACVLDAAQSSDQFFDLFYNHPDLRYDFAWAMVARTLHPDWFETFGYVQAERDVPLENGRLILKSLSGTRDLAIRIPTPTDAVDVFLFDDGQINESALQPAGVCQGSYKLGDIAINGQFSIGIDGNRVALIRWIYGADGFRISEKSKLKIC